MVQLIANTDFVTLFHQNNFNHFTCRNCWRYQKISLAIIFAIVKWVIACKCNRTRTSEPKRLIMLKFNFLKTLNSS